MVTVFSLRNSVSENGVAEAIFNNPQMDVDAFELEVSYKILLL
jgi:hypothetical protein